MPVNVKEFIQHELPSGKCTSEIGEVEENFFTVERLNKREGRDGIFIFDSLSVKVIAELLNVILSEPVFI